MRPASSPTHWARRPERGASLPMRATAWAARTLGRRAVAPVVWLVVLYFYATGGEARRAIAEYQRRLAAHGGGPALFPARFPVYRQYLAFACALLDKLDTWQGRIATGDVDIEDPDRLRAQMGSGPGQILLCSHLGNAELCRAIASHEPNLRLNVLVHSHNAVRFNALLSQAGASQLNLIQVSELDAATMLHLSERLKRGEWLAIAGDRTPLQGKRVVPVTFLGADALLPQGPWLLAGLLRCPVNTVFCTRRRGRYRIALQRLSDGLAWTRATREAEVSRGAQRYADVLAAACRDAPLQWFNFYPFWQKHA
ncbi:lipid A biosynthesis lauroyl acyltransferase [Pigmentiphaga humi]|uniref:Lipid A biosynthesis lauroyl acyltransferase n=1 Tax=Pigmentiphaga humi TaxID=2478468 RepID=A0A3P4B5N9_9BURK|nr:glycosyl transferase [Pigmentiphaga humi]VCU71372.1 lipid A biosynthesis lauroyl acyltransferase [Pigmentiphaga humi]